MEKFVVVLINLIAIVLAGWVYFSNRKEKINQWFGIMSIFIILWVNFSYFGSIAKEISKATFWYRLNLGVVSLALLSAYYFYALFFVKQKGKNILLERFITGGCVLFFFLSIFTDLIVKNSEIKEWGADLIYGSLGDAYNIFALLIPSIIAFYILRNYFFLSRLEKLRIQYFLIGTLIAIFLNIIVNIIYPIFFKTVKYQHFGDYSAIFPLIFTGYAIVARQLFGIRVLLPQALIGTIAILTLAQGIAAIPNWFEFGWRLALVLIFIYFGYLLIQSHLLEIKRRAELQRLYGEVDRLSRAKSEFISIASHQLRTPLTAIKGYISMLIEGTYGLISEKVKNVLEKVYQSNERLIKLVNDLLSVSRIESGELGFEYQETQLEEVISSVLDEMKVKADEKNLYLRWEKPLITLPKIKIDKDKIRQVILNIVDNGIKYTEKGGVTIKAELKGANPQFPKGSILIEVKDTGEGMTKEEIEAIFESWTRGRAGTKLWSAGFGIGLYIAKKFTELQGGKIWAESEGQGKGSSFYIELPIK